jgi:dTMP kinase
MSSSTNSAPLCPRGALIVFEGIDGSGKTTAARAATLHYAKLGYETAFLKEPTDGPDGIKLRKRMTSGEPRDANLEFNLFLSDRKSNVENNIRPLLNRGGLVFLDRYYISSMAYQGALGLDITAIREQNEQIAELPHLIRYFKIPLDKALKRIAENRPAGFNSFENHEYLARVAQNFEAMKFDQWVNIDASRSAAQVESEVISAIDRVLRDCAISPILQKS